MNALVRQVEGELIPPGLTVRVVGRRHPLSGQRFDQMAEAGLTVSELLQQCRCHHRGGYAVTLNLGEEFCPIEQANFSRIRVKPGVTVTAIPLLKDNGLKTALSLAVAVAAIVISIAVFGPAGALGLTGLTATIAQAVAATAIITAGSLALNALFPAIAPSDTAAAAQLNSIQGAQNQANPFGAIPVVLGRHRQSPNYAAKPYTEIIGDDQYLRLVFCLGYGPLAIEQLKIGETDLTTYTDYTLEVKQGFDTDTPVSLYPGAVDEQSLSIILDAPEDDSWSFSFPGDWHGLTTSPDTDEFSVDFTAPDGMAAVDNDGDDIYFTVVIQTQYRVAGSGGAWTDAASCSFQHSVDPARRGTLVQVTRGQYEVQVRRAVGKGRTNLTKDQVVWTALRSFKNTPPIIAPKPLALVALRIKATDQLSGVIDTFNCVTTSLVKALTGSPLAWTDDTASQNPADLFRYILQGNPNARPVADSRIDLDNLQDWWSYCSTNGFEFNQVINSAGSVFDKLCDIAAAGRAVPTFIDGKWGVIWDRPDDSIVQHFTPRNSWDFQGQRPYVQQPDGWRVKFINETNGWTEDERIVYDDGFDATNATLFESIEFPGVTDPDLIWKHGRFHIAQSRLRPEKISLSVGWEHLVCTRGDRVLVTHDAMLIGLGSGRVKSVVGQIVTFDEVVTIEAGKNYGLQFRIPDDARSISRALGGTSPGEYSSLTLVGDLSAVVAGTLFAFGETAQESAAYRVQGITHQKDLIATLTLVDDAPAISQADQGTIPPYVPNVTIPADPFTLPPQNLQYAEVVEQQAAGVRVFVRLTWQVPRFGRIASAEVQARADDIGSDWTRVATVARPGTSARVPIASPGHWSFRVRNIFADETVSGWTSIENVDIEALPRAPGAVENLRNAYINGRSFISWDNPVDARTGILIEVRKGDSFEGAQIVDEAAVSPWQTLGDDSYFVVAYATSPFGQKVYSDDQSIEVEGSVAIENVIVLHDEGAEGWTGTFEGSIGIDQDDNFLRTSGDFDFLGQTDFLGNSDFLNGGDDQASGIYWTAHVVNTGGITFCRVSNDWTAVGGDIADDFLGTVDFLAEPDFLSTSRTQLVRVRPLIRVAQDSNSPPSWGDTQIWSPDVYKGWMFQLGMQFETFDASTVAILENWSWSIDVPDRLDSYQNLSVGSGGLSITFRPTGAAVGIPFNGGLNAEDLPHLTPSIRNPTDGDLITWTGLTLSGVTLQVMNGGIAVARDEVNLLVRGY